MKLNNWNELEIVNKNNLLILNLFLLFYFSYAVPFNFLLSNFLEP